MLKEQRPGGKNQYIGEILGFHYSIELDNDQALEAWLKEKLLRNEMETRILKELLGITDLEARLAALEEKK